MHRQTLRERIERHGVLLDVAMAVLALIYIVIGEFNDGLFGYKSTPFTIGIEFAITAMFVLEYGVRLYAAEDRLHFVRTHIIELLSLISTLRLLRGLQFLRVLRFLRIARIAMFSGAMVRLLRAMHSFNRTLAEPLFAYGIVGIVSLVFFGALVLLGLEKGVNPQIHDFADAFWLAVSIVLTVGVSSAKPVTPEGRIVAGVLILGGLTCISFFSSAMAVRLQRRDRDEVLERLDRIEAMLANHLAAVKPEE